MTHLLRFLGIVLVTLGTTIGASGQGLNVFLAASSDAVGAGDAIDYTLMVSNTGNATLENVNVEVRLPDEIATFRTSDLVGSGLNCASQGICSPGETVTWAVGDLTSGENRHLIYPSRIRETPPSNEATTTVVASADNVSDIILMHEVAVDPSPLLRLSLVPSPGPAVPGEPFTYTLTYGNVGSSNPSGVVLTMDIPTGTSFSDATGGGTEAGGVVSWQLGTVGVGAGGRVEVTVVPDAGLAAGTTLEAGATLDSGVATELVVNSEAVTEVGPPEPLRFAYDLSQNAVSPSGAFSYTLTATNTNTASDLTGVTVEFRLPEQIATFNSRDVVGIGLDCSSQGICSPGETVTWGPHTLAPGQSLTAVLPSQVGTAAQQGEVLRSFYRAVADGLNEQIGGTDVVVDPSPVTGLRLIPGPAPVAPGDSLTYTLVFGNVGFQSTDLILRMTLPDAVTFVSATGGGTEAAGVVTWQAPSVAEEAVGRVQVVVEVDPSTPAGSLLQVAAELDTGSLTEYTVHSSAATPVQDDIPLQIAYSSDLDAVRPGDPLRLTMVVTNGGVADLTDTAVEFRLPDQITTFRTGDVIGSGLDCSSQGICSPGETVRWVVGTLASTQSRTIIMPTTIGASADEGTFLLSPAIATATGSNEVVLYNDVLLGVEIDLDAPAAPLNLAATADGGDVSLSWTANTEEDLDGYQLYRRTEGGTQTLVATPGASATSYFDEGLTAGTYTYQLLAFDTSDNESALSNEATVSVEADTEAPAAPLSLTATADGNQVSLAWTANTEDDLSGYYLYRRSGEGDLSPVDTLGATETAYDDEDLDAGTYTYQLSAFDASDNESALSNEAEVTVVIIASDDGPAELRVTAAPNPTPGAVRFRIAQPTAEHVRLAVYDALGREVAVILNDERPAGDHVARWDAAVPAGIYLWRLTAGDATRTGSVTVVR